MTGPLENPFWHSGMVPVGTLVDADTMTSLKVLHTLCGQLAANLAEARTAADRRDNLIALLDDLASGTAGAVGGNGYTWDGVLLTYRWGLARVYAEAAFGYAWTAARIAGKLVRGETLVPLHQWPDDERHPNGDWLTEDIGRRVWLVQMRLPSPSLGAWYAAQVADLNPLLTTSHTRMVDAVVHVLKVHPQDLSHEAPNEPQALKQDDYEQYVPRSQRLEDAAAELHTYAAACARAVVLSNVKTNNGGTDG